LADVRGWFPALDAGGAVVDIVIRGPIEGAGDARCSTVGVVPLIDVGRPREATAGLSNPGAADEIGAGRPKVGATGSAAAKCSADAISNSATAAI